MVVGTQTQKPTVFTINGPFGGGHAGMICNFAKNVGNLAQNHISSLKTLSIRIAEVNLILAKQPRNFKWLLYYKM